MEQSREKLAGRVRIRLNAGDVDEEKVATIKSLCESHKGRCPLQVTVKTHKGSVVATADRQYSVTPSEDFCRRMSQLVGKDNFQVAR